MDSNFPCFSAQKTLTKNLRHLTFAYDLNKFLNLFWNNFYQWEIIEIFDHNINKSVSVQMHSTSGSHHQNHRQKNSLCYCPKNWLHLVFVWSRLCCAAVVVIISFISWTAVVSRIFGLLENIKLNERFPTFSTHPTIVRQMSVSWCQWSSQCTMIENYLVFLEAEIPKSNSRTRNWIDF